MLYSLYLFQFLNVSAPPLQFINWEKLNIVMLVEYYSIFGDGRQETPSFMLFVELELDVSLCWHYATNIAESLNFQSFHKRRQFSI